MTEPLKLPEKMRLRLLGLYKAQQEAIARLPESNAYGGAMAMAMDHLDLDPTQRNHINLDTGIVTPASAPTPLRPEEAPPVPEAQSG